MTELESKSRISFQIIWLFYWATGYILMLYISTIYYLGLFWVISYFLDNSPDVGWS